ncbi:MAG: sulfite exporter TauE/SafE family protein [Sulfurimicrobium sp.]|nr:sulfite exporter TauE/SafE family protein [Sulfurimicrobium sp.]MDP2964382.1 sulfite exporter TauE/SafE family protein [Sulfurimicrobium sp.]MDZ7656993.1 sulfite exporter TauE/SafE family protein [Sulfurimicrobium sp.]
MLAYFIRGISGFGSGLVAVPLLAHYLPLQFVVPFILLLDFTASVAMGHNSKQHVNWKEIRPLLPFSLIGVVLGVVLLINLPKEPLLTGLGIFVMAFGIRNILNLHGEKPASQWWAIPAGLTGGTVGALFGTGGPPYIIYLSHRLRDKAELRATFSGLFMIDGGTRLVTFLIAGLLLQPGLLLAYIGALPIVAIALKVGHKVHLGISNQNMLRLIGALLLGSGLSLLWKAWS